MIYQVLILPPSTMAKGKPNSGGQSQGTPKQAAGGPSRPSNTQAANRPGNTNHCDYNYSSIIDFRYTDVLSAQKAGSAPAKHPTSSGKFLAQMAHSLNERLIAVLVGTSAARPAQNANRPPNGIRCKPQTLASKLSTTH